MVGNSAPSSDVVLDIKIDNPVALHQSLQSNGPTKYLARKINFDNNFSFISIRREGSNDGMYDVIGTHNSRSHV